MKRYKLLWLLVENVLSDTQILLRNEIVIANGFYDLVVKNQLWLVEFVIRYAKLVEHEIFNDLVKII